MLGQAIDDVLVVEPNAEFAIKPNNYATQYIRVRGLTKVVPGFYRVAEAAGPAGQWVPAHERGLSTSVPCRDLCTVEDAEHKVGATRAKHRSDYETRTRAIRLAARLDALGVPTAVALGQIRLVDLDAVEALLDRVEG